MRKSLLFVSMMVAVSANAAAVDEVRTTEIAFAQAFADGDAASFFAYVADDATFLGPKRTLSGKAEVVGAWSEFFKDAKRPFSWRPERVVTNAAGDLGLSAGPVFDAGGKHVGDYSSVWQKQKDGRWKIVFDGPGSRVCAP